MYKKLTVLLPSETMEIDLTSGLFTRIRQGDAYKGGDDWKCTGAVTFKFGRIHEVFTLEDLRNGKAGMFKYKNGKQRLFITDLDHGTYRIQMNPKSLYFHYSK